MHDSCRDVYVWMPSTTLRKNRDRHPWTLAKTIWILKDEAERNYFARLDQSGKHHRERQFISDETPFEFSHIAQDSCAGSGYGHLPRVVFCR